MLHSSYISLLLLSLLCFLSLLHPSVLKHILVSNRWTPGEGLEPSSPEGHQLARHSMG